MSPTRLLAVGTLMLMAPAMSVSAAAQDDVRGVYVNFGGAFLDLDFAADEITTPVTEVGGGVTIPETTFEIDEISANAFLINGRLGYRIHKYFAIEVDGGIGVSGDDASQTVAVPIDTPLVSVTQEMLTRMLIIMSSGLAVRFGQRQISLIYLRARAMARRH